MGNEVYSTEADLVLLMGISKQMCVQIPISRRTCVVYEKTCVLQPYNSLKEQQVAKNYNSLL